MVKELPLKKEDIVSVIEGRGAARRVPINYHFWVHPETFGEREPEVRKIFSEYPEDFQVVTMKIPSVYKNEDNMGEYSWLPFENNEEVAKVGLDNMVAIKEWDEIDFDNLPLPNIEDINNIYENEKVDDERYLLIHWWFGFFETHWRLRGMTNALMDFYIYPDKVHKLYNQFNKHFKRLIDIGVNELNPDGVFISDDIGMQSAPFFSDEIFEEFFKPYYKEIIEHAHKNDMHFWLHTCGNIEPFIPSFIEIGLDVLHPIQKHTMLEENIAKLYGDKICIWAGFDVQQKIPWGTNEEVREEVRFMIDTYYRDSGRLMLTAGNGVNQDCRVDALEALFNESFNYGSRQMNNRKEEVVE